MREAGVATGQAFAGSAARKHTADAKAIDERKAETKEAADNMQCTTNTGTKVLKSAFFTRKLPAKQSDYATKGHGLHVQINDLIQQTQNLAYCKTRGQTKQFQLYVARVQNTLLQVTC